MAAWPNGKAFDYDSSYIKRSWVRAPAWSSFLFFHASGGFLFLLLTGMALPKVVPGQSGPCSYLRLASLKAGQCVPIALLEQFLLEIQPVTVLQDAGQTRHRGQLFATARPAPFCSSFSSSKSSSCSKSLSSHSLSFNPLLA